MPQLKSAIKAVLYVHPRKTRSSCRTPTFVYYQNLPTWNWYLTELFQSAYHLNKNKGIYHRFFPWLWVELVGHKQELLNVFPKTEGIFIKQSTFSSAMGRMGFYLISRHTRDLVFSSLLGTTEKNRCEQRGLGHTWAPCVRYSEGISRASLWSLGEVMLCLLCGNQWAKDMKK